MSYDLSTYNSLTQSKAVDTQSVSIKFCCWQKLMNAVTNCVATEVTARTMWETTPANVCLDMSASTAIKVGSIFIGFVVRYICYDYSNRHIN